LERLHKCAEKDIHAVFPNANNLSPTLEDLSEFRVKLVDLTRYCGDVFGHYTFSVTQYFLDKVTNLC
jgi:hypothetical protein